MFKHFIVLILLVLANTLSAEQETLSIILRVDGAPKQYINENGNTSGYAAEIAIKAIELAGFKPKVSHLPWRRAQSKALNGEGILTGFSKSSERLIDYLFTEPLYEDRVLLVQNKENTFPFNEFTDLVNKRISINMGSVYAGEFTKSRESLTLIEDPGSTNRIQMLQKGRIDAGIFSGDIYAFKYLTNQLELDKEQFVILSKPISIESNYIGIPKELNGHDATEVLYRINNAIVELRDNGTIEMIMDNYYRSIR